MGGLVTCLNPKAKARARKRFEVRARPEKARKLNEVKKMCTVISRMQFN